MITEAECVRRYACRHGDTRFVAQFVCLDIMQGAGAVPISAFNVPPFSKLVYLSVCL